MIHLAIWLIAAFVVCGFVFIFAVMGLASLAWLAEDGHWILPTLIIVGLVIWLVHGNNERNAQYKASTAQNGILQQQCIDNVQAKANTLYQQAVANRTLTQDYLTRLNTAKSTAITSCQIKYPAY